MISKLEKINKFGRATWHIKIDSLFHIFIIDTNVNSYLVELKEFRWIKFKTRVSYMSELDLEKTVMVAFDKMQQYLNETGNYQWSNYQKKNKLEEVLLGLNRHEQKTFEKKRNEIVSNFDIHADIIDIKKNNRRVGTADAFNVEADLPKSGCSESIGKPVDTTEPKIKLIIRGVGIDGNIINLTTSHLIIEKYGEPDEIVNHNHFSFELKYLASGISFFYKQDDPIQLIYLMIAMPHANCATETGMCLNNELTISDVMAHYGVGETRATDFSDEAYMEFSGINFYAKKNDLKELEADSIYVQRIAILEF